MKKEFIRLPFKGNFRDLIPFGFEFQKLYASNYRQYSYEFPKWNNIARVWQAEGGYVELASLDTDLSLELCDLIKSGKIEKFKRSYSKNLVFPDGKEFYELLLDHESRKIIPYEREIGDMYIFSHLTENDYDEKYVDFVLHRYHKRYEKKVLSERDISKIKEMINGGLF